MLYQDGLPKLRSLAAKGERSEGIFLVQVRGYICIAYSLSKPSVIVLIINAQLS